MSEVKYGFVYRLLVPLREKLYNYPMHGLDDLKPKRQKALTIIADKIYPRAFDTTSVLSRIGDSYLLASNEVIIKPFAEECGELWAAYDFLRNLVESETKQSQEIAEFYKKSMSVDKEGGKTGLLKKQDLIAALFSDLDDFGKRYDFEYDRKDVIGMFTNSFDEKRLIISDQYKAMRNHNQNNGGR
jgi:hypothetical protein